MTESHAGAPTADRISCEEVMAILWDYLDGELSAEREAAMRRHLELCGPCLGHHEFERAFLDAVATARQSNPASPALRARVTQALQAQGLLP